VESVERNCPYCAEPIKVEALKCKHCGTSLLTGTTTGEPPKRQRKPIWPWFVLVPLVLFLVILVIGHLSGPLSEKDKAKAEIDLCWKNYKDPLASGDMKMILSEACRSLTENYENTYGGSATLRH
jgi:hypothetical protein